MMQALGYARPTLYRYLRTLRDAGLLTVLPDSTVTLGPRVTELDFLMRRADPLIRSGEVQLRQLVHRHPGAALLVRWYGTKLLCVASVVSAGAPLSSYPRGRPMPLARGAISRAILAWLPRRTLEPLVADRLEEFAGHVGSSVEEVLEKLRDVRCNGFAVGRGEVTPGVIGIAAPVFAAGSAPIAALCLTSDEAVMTEDRIEATARDICRRAATIGAELSGEAGLSRAV
jgi:DNA-binding IclR family transcriptional regulator